MNLRRFRCVVAAVLLWTSWSCAHGDVLVVIGAPGEDEYAERFRASALRLKETLDDAGIACELVGLPADAVDAQASDPADHDDKSAVLDWLERSNAEGRTESPAWLLYVGHGTWDGTRARLALRGPDLDDATLANALRDFRRPFVFVHGGSASAPFISSISAPGRTIVTATSSGDEVNFARFGERIVDALLEPAADIDRDGRTSLLEAALFAARAVRGFYDEAGRMPTEHALVDDNGDGFGTPLEWFDGTRVTRRDNRDRPVDGSLAHRLALFETDIERALTAEQRGERDALEAELERLRLRKPELASEVYLDDLERILRRLAPFYVDPARSGDT
ncbi:hypothetical protein ASA1KI_30330 [Opitutales bacterium ASA1]|uniref:hypothetical protein n=1 Tax=Congregicoccus parvus TaxID=3081749 RepID=UPI002B2AEA2A|nr:hypothetical protein ASA1KI_30330 [Opitutales bacterium ASA1]